MMSRKETSSIGQRHTDSRIPSLVCYQFRGDVCGVGWGGTLITQHQPIIATMLIVMVRITLTVTRLLSAFLSEFTYI